MITKRDLQQLKRLAEEEKITSVDKESLSQVCEWLALRIEGTVGIKKRVMLFPSDNKCRTSTINFQSKVSRELQYTHSQAHAYAKGFADACEWVKGYFKQQK